MSQRLYRSHKIVVGRSSIHGFGVFACEEIAAGEILEEIPFLEIPRDSDAFYDIRFRWPKCEPPKAYAIPLGFACIYNHHDDPSADWETDEEQRIFRYKAIRDIAKREEIFISYNFGEDYWQKRPYLGKRQKPDSGPGEEMAEDRMAKGEFS
jgi:SET domain-containing protein